MVNIQTVNPVEGASLDVEFSSVPFEKSRKPQAPNPRNLSGNSNTPAPSLVS